ncbi:MAG: GntR family transcriptional regulator [Victivallaceae bacterium]|jgi:DNA-binding LacI/PurR family transcriptional regulator
MIGELKFKNERIYEEIRNNILSGTYPASMKFPPELDFARDLQVGKVTLRAAFEQLEREGLIIRMRSRGTFVSGNKEKAVNKIAVITEGMNVPGSPSPYLLSLIISEASRRKIEIEQIERFYIEHLSLKEIKKIFKDKGFDGIILISSFFVGTEPIIKKMHITGLPVVLPHARMGDSIVTGFASVCINEREAFYQELNNTLKNGFEKIAIMVPNSEKVKHDIRSVTISEIENLLKDKLHSINYFELDPLNIEGILTNLLKSEIKPDVFVCFSDFTAVLLSMVLRNMNLLIPRDFSVMGFSGLPADLPLAPNLTGIKFPYDKLIEKTFDLLITKNSWFDPENPKTAPAIFCDYKFSNGNTVLPKRANQNTQRVIPQVCSTALPTNL